MRFPNYGKEGEGEVVGSWLSIRGEERFAFLNLHADGHLQHPHRILRRIDSQPYCQLSRLDWLQFVQVGEARSCFAIGTIGFA